MIVLQFSPNILPPCQVGVPYSQQISLAGFDEPVRFLLDNHDEPPTGLGLELTGLLSGTPSAQAPGNKPFKVNAINGNNEIVATHQY